MLYIYARSKCITEYRSHGGGLLSAFSPVTSYPVAPPHTHTQKNRVPVLAADGTNGHNKGTYNITYIIIDVNYTAGEWFNLRRVGDSSGIGSIMACSCAAGIRLQRVHLAAVVYPTPY